MPTPQQEWLRQSPQIGPSSRGQLQVCTVETRPRETRAVLADSEVAVAQEAVAQEESEEASLLLGVGQVET